MGLQIVGFAGLAVARHSGERALAHIRMVEDRLRASSFLLLGHGRSRSVVIRGPQIMPLAARVSTSMLLSGGPLLLVVNRGGADLVSFRVGTAGSDGAGLAVSRQDDATGDCNLVAFFDGKRDRVFVDLLERSRV
jgi:hypothetical protein